MTEFCSNRLVIARKRRKLTAKQLAERVGLSPVTITRLETPALANPESSTIELLAKALRFPREFFLAPEVDVPTKDNASFRSLTAMSARERDAALSAGSIAYLVADWVSERFNLPTVNIPALPSEVTPESAARTLRQQWGLGEKPISSMVKLLESKGVRVFSLCEDTRNVDAFSCWRNGIPFVFLNTFKSAEHSRFDAAHELGHLVMHVHGAATGRVAENEANRFASYFLMPQSDLLANVPRVSTLNQLILAKRRWGVSVAALAFRLHKERLVTDWQYRNVCIQMNRLYGTEEPEGLEREQSVVWEQVFRELWKDGISRDALAKQLHLPLDELEAVIFRLVGRKVQQLASDAGFEGRLRLV